MKFDRRALLGALGASAASAAVAAAQTTQTPAPPPAALPAPPPLEERITQRAMENRTRIAFENGRFSGEGYDLLVREGRAAQYFCVAEEHGIAENPKLAAQLFGAIGFDHAVVEVSPPMAAELDRAAGDGVEGLRHMFADRGANVAFFGMREEAEWLAAARSHVRGGQAIWGLDYEVGGDRRILARLHAKRKPAAAATALAALEAASTAAWAQYDQSHGPQYIFSFSGDPALVRAVRDAWPNADAEASWMLTTLEETLEINKLWVSQQGYNSNLRRSRFMRANLRRYLASARGNPRLMFKFGANHMCRGVSQTQTFEVGSAIAEIAEANGTHSFAMMVLPGANTQVAQFDPSAWTYRPGTASTYVDQGMTPLLSAAYPDAFTLIDLRPIRSLVGRRLDPGLARNILGYDVLLVMSGSTPSSNL